MKKPNTLVIISGDLLEYPKKVIAWLAVHSIHNYDVACAGGGKQTNQAFKKRGFKISFGPFGRITDSLEAKQCAIDEQERNRKIFQSQLAKNGIYINVIIPVLNIGGVQCPINDDKMLLAAYNGYDQLIRLTLKERAKKKRFWLKMIFEVFEAEASDIRWLKKIGFILKIVAIILGITDRRLGKIEVIGL